MPAIFSKPFSLPCLIAVQMLVAIAHPAFAADEALPPLPPLPALDAPPMSASTAAAPAAPTTTTPSAKAAAPTASAEMGIPQLSEMPAPPKLDTTKAAVQPATGRDAPTLPSVATMDDIAHSMTGTMKVTGESILPEARDVGSAEIDQWLKRKNPSPVKMGDPMPQLGQAPTTTTTSTTTDAAPLAAVADIPATIPDTAGEKSEDAALIQPLDAAGQTVDMANKSPAKKSTRKRSAKKKSDDDAEKKSIANNAFHRFQYKNQFLPEAIYRTAYNSDNKHLPKAHYEQDYDRYVFQAAARNDTSALRALLATPGRNLEMTDTSGQTPLMVAVRYGASGAAQMLLGQGANSNHRDASGATVLHYAVLSRHVPVVQALLAARANPFASDAWGQTPGDLAAYTQDPAMLQALRGQPLQATMLQPQS